MQRWLTGSRDLAGAAARWSDDERSWVIVSEGNDFVWGPDLRFLPGHGPESAAYGFLPPLVFRTVRDRFLARFQRRQVGLVTRTE